MYANIFIESFLEVGFLDQRICIEMLNDMFKKFSGKIVLIFCLIKWDYPTKLLKIF